MARRKESKLNEACFVLLVISIELLCVWCLTSGKLVEARYLPTRSDDTQVQVLKDLIRGVSSPAERCFPLADLKVCH